MADTFDSADIINHNVYAKAATKVYDGTSATYGAYNGKYYPVTSAPTKVLYTVDSGDRIGKVDSYVNINGTPWFTLYNEGYKNAWVSPSYIDEKQLQADGVKTVEQKAKEAAESGLPWYQTLFSDIGNTVKTLAVTAVVGGLAIKFFNSRRK